MIDGSRFNAPTKYSLRSLMLVTAVLPPTIGLCYWIAGLPLTVTAVGTLAFWLFVYANRRRSAS